MFEIRKRQDSFGRLLAPRFDVGIGDGLLQPSSIASLDLHPYDVGE
jgi:hypothetical protein